MIEIPEQGPNLTQWRLVRSAIEHENTLKSHRITWFLATQLFLFTGFTSIFVEAVKNDYLFKSLKVYFALVIIFLMGTYVCILAWASLRAAEKMITRLQSWWLIHCHGARDDLRELLHSLKYGSGQASFPPVNGIFTSNLHVVFDEKRLPVAIAAFWLILFYMVTIILLQKRCETPPLYGAICLASVTFLLFLFARRPIDRWLKDTSPKSAKNLLCLLRLVDSRYDAETESDIAEIFNSPPSRRLRDQERKPQIYFRS
jgi:hypothetical protein